MSLQWTEFRWNQLKNVPLDVVACNCCWVPCASLFAARTFRLLLGEGQLFGGRRRCGTCPVAALRRPAGPPSDASLSPANRNQSAPESKRKPSKSSVWAAWMEPWPPEPRATSVSGFGNAFGVVTSAAWPSADSLFVAPTLHVGGHVTLVGQLRLCCC